MKYVEFEWLATKLKGIKNKNTNIVIEPKYHFFHGHYAAHFIALDKNSDAVFLETKTTDLIMELKRIAELIVTKLKTYITNILKTSVRNTNQSTTHFHFNVVHPYKVNNLNFWILRHRKNFFFARRSIPRTAIFKGNDCKGPCKNSKDMQNDIDF